MKALSASIVVFVLYINKVFLHAPMATSGALVEVPASESDVYIFAHLGRSREGVRCVSKLKLGQAVEPGGTWTGRL